MSEVFISHTSADDAFVAELRRRLTAQGVPVWVDSGKLRGGDRLAPEIEKAIVEAAHVVVVISSATVDSDWVSREVKKALQVQRSRPGFRVVPLLLPGMTPKVLRLWFKNEPVAVEIGEGPLGLSMAMPKLLSALGVREPTDDERRGTTRGTRLAQQCVHVMHCCQPLVRRIRW